MSETLYLYTSPRRGMAQLPQCQNSNSTQTTTGHSLKLGAARE
ncbi:hypothetical protein [Bacteroides acidifaciens]|nr:hypothetical protein [Bacteroides acidifaciens]